MCAFLASYYAQIWYIVESFMILKSSPRIEYILAGASARFECESIRMRDPTCRALENCSLLYGRCCAIFVKRMLVWPKSRVMDASQSIVAGESRTIEVSTSLLLVIGCITSRYRISIRELTQLCTCEGWFCRRVVVLFEILKKYKAHDVELHWDSA